MTASASSRPRTADLARLRSAFPALDRRHRGHPVAYFDGPGGTQVPRPVVDAMTDYLYHHNANTHWPYPTSEETDALIAGARSALADFLGATPAEIAFGANMTTLAFHLARGLGRGWGPGDRVLITELDHHANVAPWRALERDRGITVLSVPLLPATGQLDWAKLEELLATKPRLLAIGAASNALGTITDVGRAAAMARSVGALTFVDAVHYAPHELVDVARIGCDFLACSAYKFYGPHIGILFGRREALAGVDIPKLAPAPDIGARADGDRHSEPRGDRWCSCGGGFHGVARHRRDSSGPARDRALPHCTTEGRVCCSGCGMGCRPLKVSRCMARSRAHPELRPWRLPWRASQPTMWQDGWPIVVSLSPAAISTRPQWSPGWGCARGWCGPAAPATRRRKKWIG